MLFRSYFVYADRSINNNTENRITISTNGPYLSLLFLTGTTAATSCRDLISFGFYDYVGNTSYTNGATTGSVLVTDWFGFNYQPPQVYRKAFGTVNVSTSGEKEAITWVIQKFVGVEFRFEPQAKEIGRAHV